jgi:hypothetical protein
MKGLEFNLRKSFAFIVPASFLKDIYLNANVTFLKGDVTYDLQRLINLASGLDPEVAANMAASRNRPLQGMAPYMVNAGLSYSGRLLGAAVNYATTGRKLVQALLKNGMMNMKHLGIYSIFNYPFARGKNWKLRLMPVIS